jgi:hypothetical protein
MTLKTFAPKGDATVPLAASAATASATIDKFSNACRVYNAGPSLAFIRFSTGAATALTTDMPMPAGGVETFTKGSADTVAAICGAAGTASLYFTNGEGL